MNSLLFFIFYIAISYSHSLDNHVPSQKDLFERNDENIETISRETFVLDDYLKVKIDYKAEKFSGQELVNYVNQKQDLWTAKLGNESLTENANSVNHIRNSVAAKKHQSSTRYTKMAIPKSFDSRQHWLECASIRSINDYRKYNTSWALTAISTMSDRICIASDGDIQVKLSATDLLTCCQHCEGDSFATWRYFVKNGITTNICRPSEHNVTAEFPKCVKKCQESYGKLYKSDKFYAKTAYSVANNAEAIQKELIIHGPIQVSMEIYEDLYYYDNGIYFHQGGKLKNGHSVKIIGWGEDDGIPYWIIANSWGQKWGEDGFFRILRGTDECGVESSAVAGIPRIDYENQEDTLTPEEHAEMLKQLPSFCSREAYDEINWEEKVNVESKWEIFDQQKEDSCYAAAAVAVTQYSVYFNLNERKKNLLSLSTEEVTLCARCPKGKGNYNIAFAYIAERGISLESTFVSCFNGTRAYKVINPQHMPTDDKRFVKQIFKHCITAGPMAIAIHATPEFHAYKHGVMSYECKETGIKKDDLNHALVAVGYKKGYLIVRNSHGKTWGKNGFGKISLSQKNPFCMFRTTPVNVTAIRMP